MIPGREVLTVEKKPLPTGLQGFRYIRENGFYYVDKTAHIVRLTQDLRKHFFLSRPRRFGKSLLVSTLKEAFEGNEELFRGLDIHGKWDWSARHPVIRLDFAGGNFTHPDKIVQTTIELLEEAEGFAGIKSSDQNPETRLRRLIRKLYAQANQGVVLLVDEYDKPILDAIAIGDTDLAIANRDTLRGIYGVLKQTEDYMRFSFFTGVSKFSKTSLFSGVNNLNDITLAPKYSAICGYADSDLDSVFKAEIEGMDRERIRLWYNGYNWLGQQNMYNPYDILLLFETGKYEAWWYSTGSPTFLTRVLRNDRIYSVDIGHDSVSEELLSAFDVDNVDPLALLFQAGYLTIEGAEMDGQQTFYRLKYPNLEVRKSLNRLLEREFLPDIKCRPQEEKLKRLKGFLAKRNIKMIEKHLKSLLAGIPHQWYDNSQISNYEAHCASVFYSHFLGANLNVAVEDSSSRGRVDLVVRMKERVYVFEFKVSKRGSAKDAMKQLRKKGYGDKYVSAGIPIHLVAVEYSTKERNIVKFLVEDL